MVTRNCKVRVKEGDCGGGCGIGAGGREGDGGGGCGIAAGGRRRRKRKTKYKERTDSNSPTGPNQAVRVATLYYYCIYMLETN